MSLYDRLMDYQRQINNIQAQLNSIARLDRSSGGVTDHGALIGLGDDDHLQYLSKERGGWLEIPDGSWSYASATTLTVPSGAASIYAVGDQVRLKQGGGYKYFSIITVADTLLTVTGGSDYSVANAAITDAAFSKGGGVGHPGWYNYTPTITYGGGTTDPTSATITYARYIVTNRAINLSVGVDISRGTGDRTQTDVSLPINSITDALAGTGRENVAQVTTTVKPIYTAAFGVVLRVLHGTMTQSGSIRASITYDI